MNQYVTGSIIKKLRESRGLTQADFADMLNVSDKAVSKWETGKGYPDITLIEPIAEALNISVIELLSGKNITNKNTSFNMMHLKLYVCPICGNVISSTGEATVCCCGVALPVLDAEEPDTAHRLNIEKSEDEYYVTCNHKMTKEHYISFIAGIYTNGIQIVKMYPEGDAEARFKISGLKILYVYCNKHGLYKVKL